MSRLVCPDSDSPDAVCRQVCAREMLLIDRPIKMFRLNRVTTTHLGRGSLLAGSLNPMFRLGRGAGGGSSSGKAVSEFTVQICASLELCFVSVRVTGVTCTWPSCDEQSRRRTLWMRRRARPH